MSLLQQNFVENKIIHLLTGKNHLSEVSLDELTAITTEQPYFSVAQLLLTKKMKQENHAGLKQQMQKTALFFPNPFWYQLMLQHEEPITIKTEVPVFIPEPEIVSEESQEPPVISNEKLAEKLKTEMKAYHQPVDKDLAVPVEAGAYHTVDYFASLGIKLDEILAENDAMVNKVKKFTDWLKQMKRIDPTELNFDVAVEKAVQQIADKANVGKEVVTEAMAEVLVKQGKITRAVQLYSKLSFLNPEKSAYFAAKILELKAK